MTQNFKQPSVRWKFSELERAFKKIKYTDYYKIIIDQYYILILAGENAGRLRGYRLVVEYFPDSYSPYSLHTPIHLLKKLDREKLNLRLDKSFSLTSVIIYEK